MLHNIAVKWCEKHNVDEHGSQRTWSEMIKTEQERASHVEIVQCINNLF